MVRDLRAAGCEDRIDWSALVSMIDESQAAQHVPWIVEARRRAELAASERSQKPRISPMPGISLGKPWQRTCARTKRRGGASPPAERPPLPAIRIGRAVSASEKQGPPRSPFVDNGILPNGMPRMPGLTIGRRSR